jgi:hypothetical protein
MTGAADRTAATCRCVACGAALEELLLPRLATALRDLDLAERFAAVTVCCDDLPGGDDGWLRLDPPQPPAAAPRLTIFCAPRVFAERHPGGSPFPGPAVWEAAPAPAVEAGFDPDRFSPAETNAFLNHQLAFAADLLQGVLQPDLVPDGQAEALAAAWDVVVDGRLQRLGLPGYDQTRRRAGFSRLFASAGVLLPGHWQIFQSLWDGALASQAEVLGAVRHLPRL